MTTENNVDLKLILRQIELLMPLREDMFVMHSMLMRLDATVGALQAQVVGMTGELRALHAQHSRFNARVTKLEDKAS